MGSKGGGADYGPMLEYGDKALALQKEQFDYAKEISQPWLQAGTGAINQLANYMGIPTAASTGTKTREDYIKELTPQYTTTTKSSPTMYQTKSGAIISPKSSYDALFKAGFNMGGSDFANKAQDAAWLKRNGLTAIGGGTSSTVDQAALNAAVDAALAAQASGTATPDGFGKLLETYTGQDIYTDPSYQYRLSQGQKAAERQLAASGKYLTPAASAALMNLGQEMGSQEYQNAYNRFNADQGNLYNRLANLAGMGQTQSSQVIGAGQNYANAGTDLYTGMGNSIVAANQAAAANSGSMFNTLLQLGGTLGGAYLMGPYAAAGA